MHRVINIMKPSGACNLDYVINNECLQIEIKYQIKP